MQQDPPELTPEFINAIPPGDERERAICRHCGFIDYKNPRIVVGSVATFEEKILLCRRAIEPRLGYWTLPAGFLELNETVEDGAKREAFEEARARLEIDRLLGCYSVMRASQIQLIFRARLISAEIDAGPESQEVALFSWRDIPWADIAFPTVGWALRHYHESKDKPDFAPYGNPVDGV